MTWLTFELLLTIIALCGIASCWWERRQHNRETQEWRRRFFKGNLRQ